VGKVVVGSDQAAPCCGGWGNPLPSKNGDAFCVGETLLPSMPIVEPSDINPEGVGLVSADHKPMAVQIRITPAAITEALGFIILQTSNISTLK